MILSLIINVHEYNTSTEIVFEQGSVENRSLVFKTVQLNRALLDLLFYGLLILKIQSNAVTSLIAIQVMRILKTGPEPNQSSFYIRIGNFYFHPAGNLGFK